MILARTTLSFTGGNFDAKDNDSKCYDFGKV